MHWLCGWGYVRRDSDEGAQHNNSTRDTTQCHASSFRGVAAASNSLLSARSVCRGEAGCAGCGLRAWVGGVPRELPFGDGVATAPAPGEAALGVWGCPPSPGFAQRGTAWHTQQQVSVEPLAARDLLAETGHLIGLLPTESEPQRG